MTDPEPRFTESSSGAGAGGARSRGVASHRVTSPCAEGSSAPAGRLLRCGLAALAAALVLAFGAGSASAELRHTAVSESFGPDGTELSGWSGLRALAIHQPDRIYVAASGPNQVAGLSLPLHEPLGPPFPIETPFFSGQETTMDVDNTGGPRDGTLYVAPLSGPNRIIRAYNTVTGEELPHFPIDTEAGRLCGVAVDSQGYVWGGSEPSEAVLKYDPATGNKVGEVDVHELGPPCGIRFDQATDDLFVRIPGGANAGIWKATASSGYEAFQRITPPSFKPQFAVNTAKHVLYAFRSGEGPVRVEAYDTNTGELIERVEATSNVNNGLEVKEADDTLYIYSGGEGPRVKVVPLSEVPKVITGDPTGDESVSGSVDPDGSDVTECYFDFGTTFNYGSTQECSPTIPPNYTEPKNVSAELPGLTKETTYHYRLVAANENFGGTNKGFDKTITPHWVPVLRTEGATEVTRTSANLHASFEGNGEETNYFFEYGETTGYGEVSEASDLTPEPPVTPAPAEHQALSFNATGLTAGKTYHYRVVAENEAGGEPRVSHGDDMTFTTPPAVSNVGTDPATGVTTSAATLHGHFDIDALGGQTHYYFEYGLTKSYGSTTAAPPGHDAGSTPSTQNVEKAIGVNKGTTYHYRIVVTNSLGTTVGSDQQFTSAQEPSVVAATSSNVTASTADLIARINPNGSATSYRFEYGTTPGYGQVIPIPDKDIGGGTTPVLETQHLEGLEVGAAYHFRVVAENQWGEAASQDQTFAFFTPNCPNAVVRQQGGAAYLPDCRAYELVSPENAGSIQLFPGLGLGPIVQEFIPQPPPNNTGLAMSPARFSFWGGIGQIPGTNPPNITQDMYVSTRTEQGWETHYPGLSEEVSFASGNTQCSASMDKCLNYDIADPLEIAPLDTGSNAPWVFDADGNSAVIGRFPTMVEEILPENEGETFTGEGIASADFSHFAFSSNDIPFAGGGLEAAPGSAYDNDAAANTATIISNGIVQDPEGCSANFSGLQRECQKEFIRIQALSSDGSHILMSNWAPPLSGEFPSSGFEETVDRFKRRDVHLTMRVDDAVSYDITGGHRAEFVGMTRDGSMVFFTSDEHVTGDDTDSSIDLFRWDEATNSVTRISTGSGETGNKDECNVGWVPSGTCGVQTPDAVIETPGEPGELFTPDNWISQSGEIYFYSPEQLDGGAGFANARNLYVYRGGQTQYVASFDAARPTVRMQVAPDGAHMAFVTASKVTGYENSGLDEMYLYEPADDQITCVSCVPTGEPPTSKTIASQNGLFMSDDGRTFFSTMDALVPFDSNGLRDVYEYVDGRPQLISSGTAVQDTWGGGLLIYPSMTTGLEGVSADGIDVYFSTFDTLVPQDQNGEFIKFYDARTGGGFAFSEPPPPCKAADECHGATSVAPANPQVGTGAPLAKTGNVRPNCGQYGRKAKKESRRAKKLRKQAKRASSKGAKRRLSRQAQKAAGAAKKSSKAAKRCRRNARSGR